MTDFSEKELLEKVVDNILSCLKQEREREIITRRFGLDGKKETLEQVGKFLGVTRERIRQLEKAVLIHLKIETDNGSVQEMNSLEKIIVRNLIDLGSIATIKELTKTILKDDYDKKFESALIFVSEISEKLVIVDDNDSYKISVGLASEGDKKTFKAKIDEVVKTIKKNKEPITIDQLDHKLDYDHPNKIKALAKSSKKIATLNGVWGLTSWSVVNPRNIKDKIYIVLKQANKPLHYSDIAKEIKNSEFKRRNVTQQAIHNELIKDKRFVLIGRGIYALSEWGYNKGTVADIITQILQENGPTQRDEIVKQVLKRRKVKETTVLLNLQARKEFHRVSKAKPIYGLVKETEK